MELKILKNFGSLEHVDVKWMQIEEKHPHLHISNGLLLWAFPGNFCTYQQYLGCYWSDLDQTFWNQIFWGLNFDPNILGIILVFDLNRPRQGLGEVEARRIGKVKARPRHHQGKAKFNGLWHNLIQPSFSKLLINRLPEVESVSPPRNFKFEMPKTPSTV